MTVRVHRWLDILLVSASDWNSLPDAGSYRLTAPGYAESWLGADHVFGMGYIPPASGAAKPVTLTFYAAPAGAGARSDFRGLASWTKVTRANDLAGDHLEHGIHIKDV